MSYCKGIIGWASDEAGDVFESKLIQELGCWWPGILEVPCLVEGGMVAGFCVATVEVKVANVLVCRGVPEEQSGEVVFVQFGALIPCLLDAYMRTKEFEVLEVWFDAPPSFEVGDTRTGVDTSVVEVGCMEQSSRPILRFQSSPIEEGASCDCEDTVPFFSLSVLGWAVGTSWFDLVAKFRKSQINERM